MTESNEEEKEERLPKAFTYIHRVTRYFIQHPTVLAAILYGYATYTGFLYSKNLYGNFGVNVFDYAQPSDFFLAAFREPIAQEIFEVLFLLALALLGSLLFIRVYLIRFFKNADKKALRPKLLVPKQVLSGTESNGCAIPLIVYSLLFVLIIVNSYFLYLLSNTFHGSEMRAVYRAQELRHQSPNVRLYLKDDYGQQPLMEDGLSLIGKTGDVSIFYSHSVHRGIVIPNSNIAMLEIHAVARETKLNN